MPLSVGDKLGPYEILSAIFLIDTTGAPGAASAPPLTVVTHWH